MRANSTVYCTTIYKETKKILSRMLLMLNYKNSQPKEDMISWERPNRQWHTLWVGIFVINQEQNLIVIVIEVSVCPRIEKHESWNHLLGNKNLWSSKNYRQGRGTQILRYHVGVRQTTDAKQSTCIQLQNRQDKEPHPHPHLWTSQHQRT